MNNKNYSTIVLVLGCAILAGAAFSASTAAAAPSVVYTYKSSLQDISCSGNICIAVGNNVILRSTNKGVSWKIVSSKKLSAPNDGPNLEDVDCAATTCVAVGSGATMVRSSDGGKTWKVTDNFLVSLNKDSFTSDISGVDCIDKDICYAIGNNFHNGGDATKFDQAYGGVVLKTINGGITWSVVSREKAKKFTSDYAYSDFLPTQNPDTFRKVYGSGEEPPLGVMRKIVCRDESDCYGIGGPRLIFHTTDGWKTATVQQFKIDDPVKVLTNGPNDSSSIGYSVEQKIVSVPQKVARYNFSGIAYMDDGGVIAEDMGDGTHVILKSTDKGANWTSINVPLPLTSRNGGGQIACYKAVCVIVAQNIPAKKIDILTSTDSGNTWKASAYNKRSSVNGAVCVSAKSCFAVGDTIPKGVIMTVK